MTWQNYKMTWQNYKIKWQNYKMRWQALYTKINDKKPIIIYNEYSVTLPVSRVVNVVLALDNELDNPNVQIIQ